jgi:hypothetical protein
MFSSPTKKEKLRNVKCSLLPCVSSLVRMTESELALKCLIKCSNGRSIRSKYVNGLLYIFCRDEGRELRNGVVVLGHHGMK